MVRRLIDRADVFSREMRMEYVGSEHVLVAILSESDSVGATILRNLGITEVDVLKEIAAMNNPAVSND